MIVKRRIDWIKSARMLACLLASAIIACGGKTADGSHGRASQVTVGGTDSTAGGSGGIVSYTTGAGMPGTTSGGIAGSASATGGSVSAGGSLSAGLGGTGAASGGIGGIPITESSGQAGTHGVGGTIAAGGAGGSVVVPFGGVAGTGGTSDAGGGATSTSGAGGTAGTLGGTSGVGGTQSGAATGTAGTPCPQGMILIGPGDFLMGSDASESLVRADEMPRHQVTLRAYCLEENEVTNAQYQTCVDAGLCSVPRTVDPPSGYGDSTRAKRPAVGLSWDQATAYCGFANKRLPTEAEWEKAARGPAPDVRLYPWGDVTSPDPPTIYFCPQNSDVDLPTYDVSPYGIRGMVSSAPEWVADWYDAAYYATSPSDNPTGPTNGTQHVVRSSPCASCSVTLPPKRVSYRQTCAERSIDAVGVRCAKDVGP